MDFLLEYSNSVFLNRIMFLTVFLFVICVCLWRVITNKVDLLYTRGKRLGITILLLGSILSLYYIYDSIKGISELNEISKGNIGQYYKIEKDGDTLLFSEKGNYKSLKDTFSSSIQEETDSDYVLIIKNKKELIPKSIVQ